MVARLHMVPLLPQRRVIGQGLAGLHLVVELRCLQATVVLQRAKHRPVLGRRARAGQLHQMNVRAGRQSLHPLQAVRRSDFGRVLLLVEHHNEFSGQVTLGRGRKREPEAQGQGRQHGNVAHVVHVVFRFWLQDGKHRGVKSWTILFPYELHLQGPK